jgi:2-polyprenyl-6-methoxyphenol hydroxylase-like FAD-dependent oxidoreductase
MKQPNVIISGGGPSGLLTAILLNRIGVKSTVVEKASEADEWNSKSYTIVLGDRGCEALEKAGLLDVTKDVGVSLIMCYVLDAASVISCVRTHPIFGFAGNERHFIYFYDGKSGNIKAIPKKTPGIGFTRPSLVSCLEKVAQDCTHVTIQRGAGVSSINSNHELNIELQNGITLSATHLIGAHGKWSKVRESFPEFAKFKMETVPSFGVHMNAKAVDGFKRDGTYVINPSKECMFYIVVSPRESEEEGFSVSMVCYDETVERYPFLKPPTISTGGWEDEYSVIPGDKESNDSLAQHLEDMFQEELPAFYAAIDKDAFQTARVNRRVTWVKTTANEEDEVYYASTDGQVALIGDAAHAMTPSLGEGCNCALESAVKLVENVQVIMERKGESTCSIESMNEGFMLYGVSRPKEVMPIQEQSASRNYLKKSGNAKKDPIKKDVSESSTIRSKKGLHSKSGEF